jgi:hypothetical protein
MNTTPFASADEAWFWTVTALAIRHGVTGMAKRPSQRNLARPCGPDDVIRALDLLYREGSINPSHARVLRRWGEKQVAPTASGQAADATLWNEAMQLLDGVLRVKGIVA